MGTPQRLAASPTSRQECRPPSATAVSRGTGLLVFAPANPARAVRVSIRVATGRLLPEIGRPHAYFISAPAPKRPSYSSASLLRGALGAHRQVHGRSAFAGRARDPVVRRWLHSPGAHSGRIGVAGDPQQPRIKDWLRDRGCWRPPGARNAASLTGSDHHIPQPLLLRFYLLARQADRSFRPPHAHITCAHHQKSRECRVTTTEGPREVHRQVFGRSVRRAHPGNPLHGDKLDSSGIGHSGNRVACNPHQPWAERWICDRERQRTTHPHHAASAVNTRTSGTMGCCWFPKPADMWSDQKVFQSRAGLDTL